MLAIKLKRLATIMLILLYISMQQICPNEATKLKTKTKVKTTSASASSLTLVDLQAMSATKPLVSNKLINVNGHRLELSSAAENANSGISLHDIDDAGASFNGVGQIESILRHERSKQRRFSDNEPPQSLNTKHVLHTPAYMTKAKEEAEENMLGNSYTNANDLSSKHRRQLDDTFSKNFHLLRDINVEKVDEEEQPTMLTKDDEKQVIGDLTGIKNVTKSSSRARSNIGSISSYNTLHRFFQAPTAFSLIRSTTQRPPQSGSSSTRATTTMSFVSLTRPTTSSMSSTMTIPVNHKTRKMHKNKLEEDLRLLDTDQYQNDQLAKGRHHYHGGGDGGGGEEMNQVAHTLPLLPLGLGRHPPIAKESIDLDMNDVEVDDDVDEDNLVAVNGHKDNKINTKGNSNNHEKDVIKSIIGEVSDYGSEHGDDAAGGGEEEDDGDENNTNTDDEGIMDDLNGFDASDDSDDDDEDDDDDGDADDDDDEDVNAVVNDNNDNNRANENEDKDPDIANDGNNAEHDDNQASNNDEPSNKIVAVNDETAANDGSDDTNDNEDNDVGDDVFDNDYSNSDDVFSDFSAYQNDDNDGDDAINDDVDGDLDDYDTSTSRPLLDHQKQHEDLNKRPYNNFTETYIKDKKNELSLDNYLRKTSNLAMVPPLASVPSVPSTPPSAERLKSELNIPLTKIDQNSLVDFSIKPNHTITLQSQDFDFLSNTLLQQLSNNNESDFDGTAAKDYPHDLQQIPLGDPNAEPQISASTSVGGINLDHHTQALYEKEEINFNDSDDSTSLSKDLTMDDAYIENNNHANGFPLTDSDADDTNTETLSLDVAADSESDEPNPYLEGAVDAANAEEIYDWDEISRSNRRNLMRGRDVVTKFLQIVETQHSLGSNCEAGTSLNLGEGVVDRYAQDRFTIEAEVAVNRANMLTRIFKMTSPAAQSDINLLHASVLSMVEFDDDIFAAGHCFDWNEHPSQVGLFCPFAYRLPPPNLGAILAKDLSMEYHYLGNTSEWFFQARKNAEKVIVHNEQYLKAFHLYSNKTDERIEYDTLAVKYEDGRWSKPYYDCGGGNIWMLTYTVPFFGYENGTYHFKGTSGIDIDLRRVDIDQCPQRNIPGSTKPLNIFAGTDKCKQRTTMCEAIQGLGFRRGSYKCVCRKGYYFPDTTSHHKYFNGSLLEEEYEKLMLGKNSTYNIMNEYECLPCAEGCDFCEDSSPCIAALNWPMRTSILVLACIVIGLLPPAAWFTFRYQQVKVVRAASPALLRVIALGAFFIYCTNIVMYPNPNLYTCTARIWLREIGFSLTYGALMLKTWRISVIFRVRSAKAVKITDAALLKRLGCICGAIGTCLLVRTLVSPPDVVVGRTADDLKAFLCKTDWWDYTFTSMEVVFLAWGVRLCIMVRKAPSEFNESRFISMAIYNEFLLTCFLNVSMLFLQSPANPDLLYIIFFCHTQLTITLLLALIFGSKVYIVLRSGKSHQESIGMGAKSSGAKFNFRPQVRTFANPSSVTTSTVPVAATTSAENKLSDQEAMEEIRQLSMQLQRIQEMAPPKGVAVMTISSLLDGLKTPGSMVMVAAAASQVASGGGGNQLTVRPNKPEALPLLSLNSEMQKYSNQLQQQQQQQKTKLTTSSNNNEPITAVAAVIPSTKITMATPLSGTTTTPKEAIAQTVIQHEEKAINTELSGNCVAQEQLLQQQQQQQEHIICERCYEKCKDNYQVGFSGRTSPAPLTKCQMMGSPPPEGSLTFKNIKLECMCSQSDDLDQLPQRKVAKRTAATNTPPPSGARGRKHSGRHSRGQREAKALSSASLPCDDSTTTTANKQPISYISTRQQQQQICDNCKNKFKTLGERCSSKQHRKLSRLSTKCSKLLTDIEKSRKTKCAKNLPAASSGSVLQQPTSENSSIQKQYSTDDIIFYTTTDTSSNDEDSEDDEAEDDEDADHSTDMDAADDDDQQRQRSTRICCEDSSSLSQSKSESKVPTSGGGSSSNKKAIGEETCTKDSKIISQSLINIMPNASAAVSSQTAHSNNALLENKCKATSTSSTSASTAPSTSTIATTSSNVQQQAQTANGNGKSKRPDKLVLNLNDRSKFTKEVSV